LSGKSLLKQLRHGPDPTSSPIHASSKSDYAPNSYLGHGKPDGLAWKPGRAPKQHLELNTSNVLRFTPKLKQSISKSGERGVLILKTSSNFVLHHPWRSINPQTWSVLKTTLKREHTKKLDEEIRGLHLPLKNFDLFSPRLLLAIVDQSGSRMLAKYSSLIECKTIIKSEPRLRNMLLDGSKNGYKSVRLLSKHVSGLNDCTSNAPIVELLRPGAYQSKISWRSYQQSDLEEYVFEYDDDLECATGNLYRAWAPPQLRGKGRIIGYEWHI